jgi:hypothetical protein
MRKLIATLIIALFAAAPLFGEGITALPSPHSTEAFSYYPTLQSPLDVVESEHESHQQGKWFRVFGYLTYASSGASIAAEAVRARKDPAFSPDVEGFMGRVTASAVGAAGVVMVSDQMYKTNPTQAWYVRVLGIGAYAFLAHYHLRQ